MISGLKVGTATFAVLAVMGFGAMPVLAADLGGDCCADLEERIAELEATTARKGNRKVKLEVSGWVNEAVFFWDDGVESNVYVGTNSLEQSRVQFKGEATIADGWSAGYRLELGVNGAASNTFSQDGVPATATASAIPPTGTTSTITVRQSHWYVKSKTLGKLSVGLAGTATYHLLDDTNFTQTRNVSDAEAATVALGQFRIRSGGLPILPGQTIQTGLSWRDISAGVNNDTVGQNGRRNIVRYDTPEFAGFVMTGSWGEDDQAGMALKYSGEFHDFKLAGSLGYEKSTDENLSGCARSTTAAPPAPRGEDCEWWGASGTVMHEPTGLYVLGAYAELKDDNIAQFTGVPAALRDDTSTMWYVQGGIEQKFNSLGKTTIFGEYRNDQAGTLSSTVQSSDLDFWAAGIVQGVDAAAMQLYVVYRHNEGDVTTVQNNVATNRDVDAFDMVITGGRIQF